MAGLRKLQAQALPDAVEEFFQKTRQAEEVRQVELHAAVTIQKYIRGFLTRRRLDKLTDVVLAIQRVWRGYMGRQRARLAREARDKRLRENYFAAMAITIQRHWRGFWSRKYVFNFHARKKYLAHVASVNAQVRAELAEEGERAARTQKAAAEAAARRAFDEKVGQLHHLLSTTSQPGIFNSPYAMATGTIPIIAGAPVEEHLRSAFKQQAKVGPAVSSSSSRSGKAGGGTFLPPIKGTQSATGAGAKGGSPAHVKARSGSGGTQQRRAKSPPLYPNDVVLLGTGQVVPRHLTLRQVVPYDTVHQAEVLDHKVAKAEVLVRHPQPFVSATNLVADVPSLAMQSIRNMEAYEDPWDPTVGARNECFTPTQHRISPARFARHTGRQLYFDPQLHTDADMLPPPTYARASEPPPHAAGVTSADLRRMAKQPA